LTGPEMSSKKQCFRRPALSGPISTSGAEPLIPETVRDRHVWLGVPNLLALTSGVVVLFVRPEPGRP
jgi:hypothetical protein